MTDEEIRTYLRNKATMLKEHAWTAKELGGCGLKSNRMRAGIEHLIDSLTQKSKVAADAAAFFATSNHEEDEDEEEKEQGMDESGRRKKNDV